MYEEPRLGAGALNPVQQEQRAMRRLNASRLRMMKTQYGWAPISYEIGMAAGPARKARIARPRISVSPAADALARRKVALAAIRRGQPVVIRRTGVAKVKPAGKPVTRRGASRVPTGTTALIRASGLGALAGWRRRFKPYGRLGDEMGLGARRFSFKRIVRMTPAGAAYHAIQRKRGKRGLGDEMGADMYSLGDNLGARRRPSWAARLKPRQVRMRRSTMGADMYSLGGDFEDGTLGKSFFKKIGKSVSGAVKRTVAKAKSMGVSGVLNKLKPSGWIAAVVPGAAALRKGMETSAKVVTAVQDKLGAAKRKAAEAKAALASAKTEADFRAAEEQLLQANREIKAEGGAAVAAEKALAVATTAAQNVIQDVTNTNAPPPNPVRRKKGKVAQAAEAVTETAGNVVTAASELPLVPIAIGGAALLVVLLVATRNK